MYPMMGGGTQKIEMNKRTKAAVPSSEYEAMKKSMLQQDAQNMHFRGAGQQLENNRDPLYGNVNTPGLTQGLVQGAESMGDSTGGVANSPLSKPTAQTAQLGFFSSTQQPQMQPEMMGEMAEAGIRQRVLGEPGGLNDRASLYRLGA